MNAAFAVAVFAVAYALIASEKVNRVVVALAGAGLIVVGVMKQTGLFEYLAIWSAKKARGEPFRIMVALGVLTAFASALLDNVTTVLLVAPVTILICERLDLPPAPYLISLALASNIGGTATLIGDPPNIIIASQGDLTYLDFLANLTPLVVVLLLANRPPLVFLREVEWPTLAFFMGLFIMVGALVKVGVIQRLADAAADLTGGRLLLAATLLLWLSGLLSAVVDNIPYVATMAPVVGSLVDGLPEGTDGTVLWWSLALGADLGGSATAIGASANVVILGLSERAGHRISFLQFTKYGALVTLVTLAISMPYLWLRYFVLA
jgi:Na+/H+ antiporter NhaD/arsenite permease-like protein